MKPLLLCTALFLFWFLLGRALLLLLPGHSAPRRELLAPAIGLAVSLISIFWLSRLGLAVSSFAGPWFTLALVAIALVHWQRRSLPLSRGYGRFALILSMALLLSGGPFLRYGFDWLSYANNDMVNYALLAQRFLGHGFFDVPSAAELFGGRSYSQTFWLQGLVERPGSELILASVAALTGLHPVQVFMPLILVGHMALISATGALVIDREGPRASRVALLTMAALALAPMLTFGAIYQLLGQTLGLAILLAGLSIFTQRGILARRRCLMAATALGSLLVSALLILYPELLPVLMAGSATVAMVRLCRCSSRQLAAVGTSIVAVGLGCLLTCFALQRYLVAAMSFLLRQLQSGVTGTSQAVDVFQQYLLPSGVAGLWGLVNIYAPPPEPILSFLIAVGLLLLFATIICSLRLVLRGDSVAVVFVLMLVAMAFLRVSGSAFGLYKMSMYIQPFLWGTLAQLLGSAVDRWRWFPLPGAALTLILLHTQWGYTIASTGELFGSQGSFNEVHDASRTGLISELLRIRGRVDDRLVTSDSSNLVLAKLQAALLEGARLTFPFFDIYPSKRRLLPILQRPALEFQQQKLSLAAASRTRRVSFLIRDAQGRSTRNGFQIVLAAQPVPRQENRHALLVSTSLQSPFNRRRFTSDSRNSYLLPWLSIRNHLLFVSSDQGKLYYSHDREHTAFYQLEGDYFYPGQTMAGIGRMLLFQVINPSRRPRMVVTLTASLKADGNNTLPLAAVHGRQRQSLPIVGRGSARIISAPLEPQQIEGRSYVALDLGRSGTRWEEQRLGLMRLYGTALQADPRRLTAFIRDISVISDADVAAWRAPRRVEHFPQDLAQPDLEYSGLYEDGWASESSFVVLDPASDAPTVLDVQGVVPDLGDPARSNGLVVRLDGRVVASRSLRPGSFDLAIPLAPGRGRHRIELRFSGVQQLPGGDRRPVAAKLTRLGFRDPLSPTSAADSQPGPRAVVGAAPAVAPPTESAAEGHDPSRPQHNVRR